MSQATKTASELAAKGRYTDSMLVHMSPREVGGLQALAESQGMSLTRNPETGLPEAFILDTVLPMVAGAGLTVASGGAITPLLAAGIVGGGTALLSGDLGKGFSAGLGAFGGAGIGSGIAASGAAATNAAASAARPAAMSVAGPTAQVTGPGLAGEAANIHLANVGRTPASTGLNSATMVQPGMDTIGAGIKDTMQPGGLKRLGVNMGTGINSLPLAGYTLAMSAASSAPGQQMPKERKGRKYAGPYKPPQRNVQAPPTDYHRNSSAERQYFDTVNPVPGYTPAYAEGGLTDYDVGAGAPPINEGAKPTNLADLRSMGQAAILNDAARVARTTQERANIENYTDQATGTYMDPNRPLSQLYQNFAGRAPDAEGYQFWANSDGTLREVGIGLARELYPEIEEAGEGDFLTGIYRRVLGREPDQEGYNFWASQDFDSNEELLNNVLNAEEFDTRVNEWSGADPTQGINQYLYQGQGAPINNWGSNNMPAGNQFGEQSFGFKPVTVEKPAQTTPLFSVRDNPLYRMGAGNSYWQQRYAQPMYAQQLAGPANFGPGDLSGLVYNPDTQSLQQARAGGLMGLAAGGMPLEDGAFIVDARTVSELGNGSSEAGQEFLASMGGQAIKGPGDGVSDSIKASIGGVQEARVARDEVMFSPEAVARIGKGNHEKGADKLYAMMDKAHAARKKANAGDDSKLRRGLM